jgi:hypothetical protein
MNPYETSTTVGGQGEIHLAGVPFTPGTEVEVVVSPKTLAAARTTDVADRFGPLLAALDHAHNAEPIGPLRRDELYDRNHVH